MSQLIDATLDESKDRVNDWIDNTDVQPEEQDQLESEDHVVPEATNNIVNHMPTAALTIFPNTPTPSLQQQQPTAIVDPRTPPFEMNAQLLLQQPVAVAAHSPMPSNIPLPNFGPQFNIPAHHMIPNLSTWTFPTAHLSAVGPQPVSQQDTQGKSNANAKQHINP